MRPGNRSSRSSAPVDAVTATVEERLEFDFREPVAALQKAEEVVDSGRQVPVPDGVDVRRVDVT